MKSSAKAGMTKELFDLAGKRVYVAGHHGMVGGAVVRRLAPEQCKILTVDRTMECTAAASSSRANTAWTTLVFSYGAYAAPQSFQNACQRAKGARPKEIIVVRSGALVL